MPPTIIDAHHHIWLQRDLPWLTGPMVPRIFGPYEAIRRDYPMAEFLADLDGLGVGKSVYIQVNWAPERYADEVAWVSEVHAETGWPHAIVGYADMLADDVRPQLERLAEYPLMRGIRMQIHWHENEMYRFAQDPDLATDPLFRINVAALADFGWSFDLQVFTSQMAGAAALAAACPDVPFILQHAGMPEDRTPEGRAAWRAGLETLAAQPNVNTKLSAFGTFIHRNDPAFIAEVTAETVAVFGPERCLWGSNFPIEKLWTDYASVLRAHRDATAGMDAAARDAIFHDTAARIYRPV
ncbi:MAG: amidohydrolase family protein [Rhodospirillaceae bacterium]